MNDFVYMESRGVFTTVNHPTDMTINNYALNTSTILINKRKNKTKLLFFLKSIIT